MENFTIAGFSRLRALSTAFNDDPASASRPFDRRRDGFVMGEGCGLLFLESLESAKIRRAPKIYAEILGYGLSGDASHLTAPTTNGDGAFACMRQALSEANIRPEEIGYINAHATSTPVGDKAECEAIQKCFGNSADLQISSIKGQIGHLLGAAGAVEAAATVLACFHGVLPPIANFESTEIEIRLNFVANRNQKWTKKGRKIALKNSFGFGGTNGSLCISEYIE